MYLLRNEEEGGEGIAVFDVGGAAVLAR